MYHIGVMSKLALRPKTQQELLRELQTARDDHAAVLAAIQELASGAVSATISTAGGSRSYTRASLSDLRGLLASLSRRINNLASIVTGRPNASKPHRVTMQVQ